MYPEVTADLARFFSRAPRDAVFGLGKHGEHDAGNALPPACPYGFDEIVRHDWYPKNRHGLTDPGDVTEP